MCKEGKTWDRLSTGTLANGAGPDLTPQNAASDQGMHWLLKFQIVNPCPAEPGYTLLFQTV